MAQSGSARFSKARLEPPPSADPGSDFERILREIRESEPKIGCLGKTATGTGAILATVGLALVIIYLLRRRGS